MYKELIAENLLEALSKNKLPYPMFNAKILSKKFYNWTTVNHPDNKWMKTKYPKIVHHIPKKEQFQQEQFLKKTSEKEVVKMLVFTNWMGFYNIITKRKWMNYKKRFKSSIKKRYMPYLRLMIKIYWK